MTGERRDHFSLVVVLVAGLVASGWSGWLGARHVAGDDGLLIDRLEEYLADLRLRLAGSRRPFDPLVIVAIDDQTVETEGGYPLNRYRLAELIDAIREEGAKTIAVDLLFVNEAAAPADQALAGSLSRAPSVIAAAGRFEGGVEQTDVVPLTRDELWPLPMFAAVSQIGLANVATDSGGMPRHVPLILRTSRGLQAAFALQTAATFLGEEPSVGPEHVELGGKKVALDLAWYLPLRILGPAQSIPTLSANTLLARDRPRADLTGRLVVLGVTATAIGDAFGTPFDAAMPGVEIQAMAIGQLLGAPSLRRDSLVRRIDAALALLFSVAGALLVALVPLTVSLPALAVALAGLFGLATVLFAQGIWISAALPLAAILPAGLAAFARQMIERREARLAVRAEEALSRLQPAAIAQRVAADSSFLLRPVEQRAAILFLDLAGFTALSERLGSAGTERFLVAFHTLVVEIAGQNDGIVLNLMGDGAMIAFGFPDEDPHLAEHALAAAFALAHGLAEWRHRREREVPEPSVRVGVHAGPVVMSRLGHRDQQQISVSGDTVNVASRFLEVAKAQSAVLVTSCALLEEGRRWVDGAVTGPDDVQTVLIRGRHDPMGVALWRRLTAAEPHPPN